MSPRPDDDRCRECGRDLKTVAPRNIIMITPEAKVAAGKHRTPLLGYYCSTACALTAYDRGIPRHH